jgi:hypothetical protein
MLKAKLLGATAGAAPAIEYVGGFAQGFAGSTSDITISLTSLTGGIASAPAEGDLVVVYFGAGSTFGISGIMSVSGYLKVAGLSQSDSYDANLIVSHKFMGSTPDTSFVLTGGTQSNAIAGAVAVHVFRNVDPILPLDVTTTTAQAPNTGVPNPPAITPTTENSVIVSGGVAAHVAGVRTFTSSDLTDFVTAGANDDIDVSIGAGYHNWTSGSFDPAVFGGGATSSTDSWVAVTLALRPNQNISPPEFIASAQQQNTTNGNSLTIDKPAGTLEGDLMVAFMAAQITYSFSSPAGWTEIGDYNGVAVAYKVAGASEGSSYTFSSSLSASKLSGAILTYRGAAYDAIGSFAGPTNNSVTATGPSAAENYSRLIGFGSTRVSDGGMSSSMSTTRALDNDATHAPSWIIGDDAVIEGATGTRSFATTSFSQAVTAVLLTIKPA